MKWTLLTLTAIACHGEPFSYAPPRTDQPFAPGNPAQLTFGGGRDANWLADGSAFVYSGLKSLTQYPDTILDDCLGVLASTGGQSRIQICQPGIPQLDSTDVIEMPAVSPSGRLVFLHSALKKPQLSWARRELVLSSLDSPGVRRVLVTVPEFSIPPHNGLAQVSWLDDQHFVYRADFVQYSQTNPPTTTPLYVMLVDVSGASAVFDSVPGLSGATNVVASGTDAIIYTRPNDAHVYRHILSTGATSVLWDFGAGTVVRSLQATAGRFAARLSAPGNLDEIACVDLDDARTTSIAAGNGFGSLALSPNGRALIAEHGGNLFRYTLP